MPERFLIRTEGGPNPGSKITGALGWPPPELLMAEGGYYVKGAEIQVPSAAGQSPPMRGAEYSWQPGDATAGQLTQAIAVALGARRLDEVVALMHVLALQDPGRARLIHDALTLRGGSNGARPAAGAEPDLAPDGAAP